MICSIRSTKHCAQHIVKCLYIIETVLIHMSCIKSQKKVNFSACATDLLVVHQSVYQRFSLLISLSTRTYVNNKEKKRKPQTHLIIRYWLGKCRCTQINGVLCSHLMKMMLMYLGRKNMQVTWLSLKREVTKQVSRRKVQKTYIPKCLPRFYISSW